MKISTYKADLLSSDRYESYNCLLYKTEGGVTLQTQIFFMCTRRRHFEGYLNYSAETKASLLRILKLQCREKGVTLKDTKTTVRRRRE